MAELIHTDTVDTILQRRSVRAYTEEPLTDNEIHTLLQCGLWAPSGRNDQTTKFAVLTNREKMDELQKDALEGIENPPKWLQNFFYSAPCLIFAFDKLGNRWTGINAALAVENMHIAAHSLGLGSVILGIIRDYMQSEKGKKWKTLLGMPEDYSFVLALAVGHPEIIGKAPARDENNIIYIP